MSAPPNLPHGYLGAQPKFKELGLSTFNESEPEITAKDNQIEIKLKFKEPVKITHQLINCRTEADVSEYVFTQTLNNIISFIVHMPESGYFKFQIFALATGDDSKSLPNVYNYLINCVQALHPIFPFPKQYAQWKDGCYLHAPLVLHKDAPLKNVNWKVIIPNAKAVAVVADGEWFHLDKKGNHWEGQFNMEQFKGKDTKVTLNANTGPDETKFTTMLMYNL